MDNSTIYCTFPLTGAPTRIYSLRIVEPDGKSCTLPDAFLVTNTTTSISAISPVSGNNTMNQVITISGTGFRNGLSIYLQKGSSVIEGTVQNRNSTRITGLFPLWNAYPGVYDLIVRNTDGYQETRSNIFTILLGGPKPVITDLSPSQGINTATLAVTINGTNFRDGVTVSITNGSVTKTAAGILTDSTRVNSSLPLTGLPVGLYTITVRNTDGSNATLQNVFSVISPAPSITSIAPTSGYNTTEIQVAITGKTFVSGCSATLVNGSTTIPGTVISFGSTKITARFQPQGYQAGSYNLTITNPGGLFATKPFTILEPGNDPTLTDIIPVSGLNTATVPVTINGTNFEKGITVTLTNGSSTKTVSGTVTGTTKIKCSFSLKGLQYGIYNLTARNTDGSSWTLVDAFTVMNPVPVIATVTPVSGFTESIVQVQVTGTKFTPGITLALVNGSTRIDGLVSGFSASRFTGTFDLNGIAAKTYTLMATNPGGPNATKPFPVSGPGTNPVISAFSPVSGPNTGPLSFVVNGENFRKGATVSITNGTTMKTVATTLTGSSVIKCTLPLKDLPYGLYNITVRNSDGSSVTRNDGFFVTNPVPVITALTPPSGPASGTVAVVIKGKNFAGGLTIALVNGSGSIPGTVGECTPSQVSGSFLLTGADPGLYNLTVSNPGGTNATKSFTVLSPAYNPTITGISPGSGINTQNLPVIISGSNFRKGATVTLADESSTKTVTASSVKDTQITCSLPLAGLPVGLYNITVRNTDGTRNRKVDALSVTSPVPTITKITPATGYNSSAIPVTITGTRFQTGAEIVLENGSTRIAGIVASLTATKITGTFPLNGILAGSYNLTVSNPGKSDGTKPNAFTVIAAGVAPQISAVSPASGFNTGNLPVTITGSLFMTPAVYLNQGSLSKQATPTSGKTSTATTLYVTLPLKGVPGGLYTITVRNSDGVNATGTDLFYVTDQAWISKAPKTISRSQVGFKPVQPSIGRSATPLVATGPAGRQVVGWRGEKKE